MANGGCYKMGLSGEDVYGLLNGKIKEGGLFVENEASESYTKWRTIGGVNVFNVTDDMFKLDGETRLSGGYYMDFLGSANGNVYYISNLIANEGEVEPNFMVSDYNTFTGREKKPSNVGLNNFTHTSKNEGMRIYIQELSYDKPYVNIEISKIVVIDLSSVFGKGNEPTVEQMDEVMKQFPSGYFKGIKNIFNPSNFMGLVFKELEEIRNAITTLGGNT